jgi:hypothetical protein
VRADGLVVPTSAYDRRNTSMDQANRALLFWRDAPKQ